MCGLMDRVVLVKSRGPWLNVYKSFGHKGYFDLDQLKDQI